MIQPDDDSHAARPPRILCVDDNPQMCRALEIVVRESGYEPCTAGSVIEALDIARREVIDLVVTDQQMPGLRGVDLIALLRAEGLETPVILLTAYGAIGDAVESMHRGAQHYLVKPVDPDVLSQAMEKTLAGRREAEELSALRQRAANQRPGRRMVGGSFAFRRLMRAVQQVATSRATVLIEGETGTGKELVAQAIRDMSDRAGTAYVTLNCAALPDGLIESALFGHERGAFTGAVKRSIGAFERANGGTLLLDEISEMRLDLQAKLLRVLQEQEFERVGGSALVHVDVRVIATTNRDLAECVQAGTFREDLYYRLNVVHLRVPPLRERREDIAILARYFAARAAHERQRDLESIAPGAMEALEARPWPGNVRELQHAIERAVVTSDGPRLEAWHFAPSARWAQLADAPSAPRPVAAAGLAATGEDSHELDVAKAEERLIHQALERCGHNRTAAAALLGMHVRTLRRKLKAFRARSSPSTLPSHGDAG
jgi:DNA-binding NtrC family response regulator